MLIVGWPLADITGHGLWGVIMSRAWITQPWIERYRVISQLQPHETCHWQLRCLFSEAQEP